MVSLCFLCAWKLYGERGKIFSLVMKWFLFKKWLKQN